MREVKWNTFDQITCNKSRKASFSFKKGLKNISLHRSSEILKSYDTITESIKIPNPNPKICNWSRLSV